MRHRGEPGLPAAPRGPGGRLQTKSALALSYLGLIDQEQAELRTALRRALPEARVHRSFRVLLNGLVVRAPKGSEATLARLPHVLSVRPTDRVMMRPLLDASLPLVGAPAIWPQLGGASQVGRGIKVAVIDTGIDVDNPFFDDPSVDFPPGYPRGATAYTSPKVIVARAYFRPDDPVDVTRDEPNPRDHLGHGSHVAGIIAGVWGTVFDLGGYQAVVSGVAPGAQLMSYKVFYRAESGSEGAHEPELMAAFEDAVLDGADVINNSWGGADIFGDADPALEVYGAAVEAGVTVVFAAGNEGPGDGSVAAPGQHHRFITVANSGTGREFFRHLDVVAPEPVPDPLRGVPMSVGYISPSLGDGVGPAPLRSAHLVDSGGNETACAPFTPGAFDGTVALVMRGDCTFTEKVTHASDASAIAVIVQNDNPEEAPFAMGGENVAIPAVMVSHASGEAIRGFCELHADAEVALRTGYVPYDTSGRDEVTYSSSRGPTAAGRLKPDLTAPGSPILSAQAHRVDSTSTQTWAWKSGTSMASPHVAGAAAVVRQRYPSWTPSQVKSALVGLATRAGVSSWVGGAASPTEMGAGRLQMDLLRAPRLLAEPAVLDGVELFPGEERTVTVTLRRIAAAITSVRLSLEDMVEHPGIAVEPGSGWVVSFDGEGAATVSLRVRAEAGAAPGDRSGVLVMEDDGGVQTVLPYLVRVVPAAPERDLLIVDLAFSEDNGTPDYAARYVELVAGLGLDWERASVGSQAACPSVPELERYRAVLLVTGDDREGQYSLVARWTLDRLSTFLLRGGRLLVAGQGPLRDTSHERTVALLGSSTLEQPPWLDEETGSLRPLAEYRARVMGEPRLVTAELDLTSGQGELAMVGELAGVVTQADVEPWSRPVLRLTQGTFQGAGEAGRVYDPFPLWGLDRLAESHGHRAVILGFGLELVREPEPTGDGTPVPGSAGELLQRAFQWVSDRVNLTVELEQEGLGLVLHPFAVADGGEARAYWFDAGDGSEPREQTGGPVEHVYSSYGRYEVTLVARSDTGAAALFRQWVSVQPAPPESDAGVPDGAADARDATVIEGTRPGCGCQSGPQAGGIGLGVLALGLLGLVRRRRGPRPPRHPGGLRRITPLLLGALGALAGCKHEASKLKEAYEEVIDYSIEYRSKDTVWKEAKLPGFVWAVHENRDALERPTLDVDIAVPMDAPLDLWKSRLEEAARVASTATSLAVIRVQAWPQGLVAYGGVVGTAHLAKDGRGWEGNGNTFREVQVLSGHDAGVRRPSAFDLEVLAALEKRRAILLKDPAHERRRAQWTKSSVTLDRDVIAVEAPRVGLTSQSVETTLGNARKFFWKPRWQPSPLLPGQ